MSGKRLAIVGTSTSIMVKNFGPLLPKVLDGVEISNFSLGGAPSIYGCYVMEKESIADNYDYAIIDFCINDQQLERSAFVSVEDVVSSFGATLSYFKPSSRCRPLVILFPHKAAFEDERLMKIRKLALALCRHRGITVLDMADLLDRANAEYGYDRSAYFLDWAHISYDLAPDFAKLIADMLPLVRRVRAADFTYPEYTVHVPSNFPRVKRATSLMGADTFVVKAGESIDLGASGYLCGFLHWNNEDTGTLLFSTGSGRHALPARKQDAIHNKFAFSNFPEPVKLPVIEMRVGMEKGYSRIRSFGYEKSLPMDGPEIAIAGFVIARSDPRALGAEAIKALNMVPMRKASVSVAEANFIKKLAGVPIHPTFKDRVRSLLRIGAS